jgi:hypothetical protein
MSFFIDPKPFTYRARFYGIPVYIRPDGDGMDLAGTNIIFDWLALHVAPWLHWCCEFVLAQIEGIDYEPRGWRIEILGKL